MCIPQEKYHNKTLLQNTSPNYTLFYRIFQFIGLLLLCSVYYWIITYRGGFSLTKAKLIPNWHPLFMTIVLIYLFANAILHYRSFRNAKQNLKNQHAIFFGSIIIIIFVAGIATLDSKRFRPLFTNPAIPNLYTLHSWLGIISMAMILLQFISGFWIYLYPKAAVQYREIMMPYHVFFGVTSFVLAIASGGLGFCEKMIFSLYREYEQFPAEGIIGNCLGLLCIFYGGLVVYMVTKPEFKRCPEPEYQPLIYYCDDGNVQVSGTTGSYSGGYELEIDYIRNCDSDNIVTLSDKFTVVLKPNCEVHIDGCYTTHANITSAIVDYTVQKDLIKLSGKRDGCKQLDALKSSSDIQMGLEILGLPKSCPINKGTVCLGNKPINVSKYKLRMNVLAGHLKGKSVTTTNAGKTCMEFSAKFVNVLIKAIGRGVIG